MKKLICVKDVEAVTKQGQKVLYINCKTIITPAAKDAAKVFGIEFSTEQKSSESELSKLENSSSGKIDSQMIYTVLKALSDKGLLKGLVENLPTAPYMAERDGGGLKLIRGNSVKFDVFDTGNPANKVFYQELISKDESSMSAGFLTIEKSSFEWELTYEEIDYVIEGTVTVSINGKTYTAYPGDVLYVPSGSKVVWGSPDKAKIFYTTYPANWADLV
ncbi:cupin domain-containing protein [Neobacillus sp. OS1-33]|jgi:ethanolamine utilization protein EutQ|uniref:cupin domain-containing protein n=1 Tax=Neobacillus sp. OS1-33 TaxID=3070683 RepID=UPI0027DF5478|nr:cupin domain-containing protein [Neobacillus sp. OS1-33]WML24669.1 cupin domain-containing protein [Neobacillus sp. OS1-33]